MSEVVPEPLALIHCVGGHLEFLSRCRILPWYVAITYPWFRYMYLFSIWLTFPSNGKTGRPRLCQTNKLCENLNQHNIIENRMDGFIST